MLALTSNEKQSLPFDICQTESGSTCFRTGELIWKIKHNRYDLSERTHLTH